MIKPKIVELSSKDIIKLYIEEFTTSIMEIFQIPWFLRIFYLTHHFA